MTMLEAMTHPGGRDARGRWIGTLGVLAVLLAIGLASSRAMAAGAGPRAGQPAERTGTPWWDRSWVASTRFYDIRTDLDREDAIPWGRHLDRMHEEYTRRMSGLRPRTPAKLEVLLFRRQSDYVATLGSRFGIDATGSGGMFFVGPRGSGLALFLENLPRRRVEHVIQHEGFHQFAFSRFGVDLPIWANEGLAEYFGEGLFIGTEFVLGQGDPRAIEQVRRAVESRGFIPFDELLRWTPGQWNERVRRADASLQYRQSWSIVHFLVHGDGGRWRAPFERYLGLINRGTAAAEAFTQVFGRDLGPFQDTWAEYARAAKPGSFVTAMERATFMAAGALELSRRGRASESLDSLEALREALVEIDFRHEVVSPRTGETREMRATEEAFHAIPDDGLSDEPPAFVVTTSRPRLRSTRDRLHEERLPTPAVIQTRNLAPFGFRVQWIRDRETGELTFDLAPDRG